VRGCLLRLHYRSSAEVLYGPVTLTRSDADGRVGLHRDAGSGAVDPGGPRALDADHQAVGDLLGVLAEVPDVAGDVLGEPVERVLGQRAVDGRDVVDLDAAT
jgi:hypothetical protein